MDRKIYLKFSLCLLVFSLLGQAANAQAASAQGAATPLAWARAMRASAPATASFYYDISYYDGNRELIVDTLIAETDAKRIRCVRRDKVTRVPVGITWAVYWPSLRRSAEGRTVIVNGVEKQVGRWVFWYDYSPQASNVERELFFDAQGRVVPGTEKRYAEKRPGCKYVPGDALPSVQNKLTCHSCFGSSRTVVPVDLQPGVLGVVIIMDIRDGKASPITFENVGKAVVSYSERGVPGALASIAASVITSQKQPSVGTDCYYFVTSDGAAAQNWYNTKGAVFPAPATILYVSKDNPNSEKRPLELMAPLRRLFICVENQNVYTDATLTIAVKDMRQECE